MHTSKRRGGRGAARRAGWLQRLIVTALLVAGMVVIGWPVGTTLQGDHAVAGHVTQYVTSVERTSPEVLDDDLAAARRYNAELSPDKLNDPWGAGATESGADHDRYLGTLDAAGVMGRVVIPRIRVDLPIYHDADAESMALGAGHMYGSSLPVGGAGTHAVIAAHTGMRARTYFDRLPELTAGDTFEIEAAGVTLQYRIDRILVVEPWELEAVQRVEGADYVTLVTCYTPPGSHRQRMLVRGVRVPDPTGQATVTTTGTVLTTSYAPTPVRLGAGIQQWMVSRLVIVAGTAVVLLVIAAGWAGADRRARRSARAGSRPDPRRAHPARPERAAPERAAPERGSVE